MRAARHYRSRAYLSHEIGPKNAAHVDIPSPSTHPNGWDPIRNDQHCLVQDVFKPRIALRFHDAMNPGDANISFAICAHGPVDHFTSEPKIDGVNSHPEHVCTVHRYAMAFSDREATRPAFLSSPSIHL